MQPEPDSGADPSSDRKRRKTTLLCVGNDESLLSYRCKVLSLAGFEIVAARPQRDQQDQFASLCRLHGPAMAIACHTLTSKQRTAVALEVRAACPEIPLLALTNGTLNIAEAASYDLLLDSLDGPAELIRQVRSHT